MSYENKISQNALYNGCGFHEVRWCINPATTTKPQTNGQVDILKRGCDYTYACHRDDMDFRLFILDDDKPILRIWVGYFFDIFSGSSDVNLTGFTKDISNCIRTFNGYGEDAPFINLVEYLEDLKQYGNKKFNYPKTKQVYDIMKLLIEKAIKLNSKFFAYYCGDYDDKVIRWRVRPSTETSSAVYREINIGKRGHNYSYCPFNSEQKVVMFAIDDNEPVLHISAEHFYKILQKEPLKQVSYGFTKDCSEDVRSFSEYADDIPIIDPKEYLNDFRNYADKEFDNRETKEVYSEIIKLLERAVLTNSKVFAYYLGSFNPKVLTLQSNPPETDYRPITFKINIGFRGFNSTYHDEYQGEPGVEIFILDDDEPILRIWEGYIFDIFNDQPFHDYSNFDNNGKICEDAVCTPYINAREYLERIKNCEDKEFMYDVETKQVIFEIKRLLEKSVKLNSKIIGRVGFF